MTVLGLALAYSPQAWAEGDPCLRDTDCPGAELCVEEVCTLPSVEPPSCEPGDECSWSSTCVDGYCKRDGVVCENPAGKCWIQQSSGECECADGQGAGWTEPGGPNPPPPQTDEELKAECEVNLVESCGSEPPTLPDNCVGDVLAACEALVEKEDEILVACGEGDDAPSDLFRVASCCEDFDDPEFEAFRKCLMGIEVDGCVLDEVEACFDGEGNGTDEGGGDGDGDGNDDGDPSDGSGNDDGDDGSTGDADGDGGNTRGPACRADTTGPRPATVGAFALLLLTLRRRTRRC